MNEYDIFDIIIGKPHVIYVGKKPICLYPVTFAKTILLKSYMTELSLNVDIINLNSQLEVHRLVVEKREVCCSILAIHSAPNTQKDLFNIKARAERTNVFMKMSDSDLAALLSYVLSSDKTHEAFKYLGLDKEQERLKEIMEIKKKSPNCMSFDGLSLFGTFIVQLKEMGFTHNEILYECGYTFLRLMLADKPTSIYLTDEEVEKIPALVADSGSMDANNPAMTEQILGRLANRGLTVNKE